MAKKSPDHHSELDIDTDNCGEVEKSPEKPKYPFITLIVDDNDIVLSSYKRLCESFTSEEGEVIAVSSPEEAISILEEAKEIGEDEESVIFQRRRPLITLVISNKQFSSSENITGVDILRAAKDIGPFAPYTVSFAGEGDDPEFQCNSDAFLSKGSVVSPFLDMERIFKQANGHFRQMMKVLPGVSHPKDGTPGYDGTKPMYFPRKRDALVMSNSNLRRYGSGKWVLANMIAPPEILARAEAEVARIRSEIQEVIQSNGDETPRESKELIEGLRYFNDVILRFGGNPVENVRRAYEVFNFPAYWFKDAFGNHDRAFISDQMKHIAHEVGFERDGVQQIGKLKVLDVGTGGEARIIKILHELVKEGDPSNLVKFRKSIKGFDLINKVVHDARESMKPLRIRGNNIFQGDFLNLPSKYRKEQFHMITGMMHTPWHCDTEDKWTQFLRNMEQALAPGGRLIFDTVDIINPHAIRDREKTFADFHSFYTLLWRYYCDKMQPYVNDLVGPKMDPKEREHRPVPLLRKLSRHFVQDSTAGVEGVSYVREVPTKEFLTRICKDNGINLRLAITTTFDSEIRDNEPLMRELGGKWISQNGLEGYLHHKITDRIVRNGGRVPSYQEVREVYDDIQLKMAENYRNKYMSFKKYSE